MLAILRAMLFADDAGVVSLSPPRLAKTMAVIVVVSAAFGNNTVE